MKLSISTKLFTQYKTAFSSENTIIQKFTSPQMLGLMYSINKLIQVQVTPLSMEVLK